MSRSYVVQRFILTALEKGSSKVLQTENRFSEEKKHVLAYQWLQIKCFVSGCMRRNLVNEDKSVGLTVCALSG